MTNNTSTVDLRNVYGAFELKKLYPRNYSIGLAVAVVFHLMLISTYYISEALQAEEENYDNIPVVNLKYSEMGPPPSIIQEVQPQVQTAAAAVKPSVGVPVPVEDSKAAPEQTLATQAEMSKAITPVQTISEGSNVQVTQDIKIVEDSKPVNDDPDPSTFIPVEKEPAPIQRIQPQYPEIAERAGLTGTVHLRVLVSKEGKPIRTVVIKADHDIFIEPAKAAAMKTLFTPAIQNGKPITCWVNIPYKFSMNR